MDHWFQTGVNWKGFRARLEKQREEYLRAGMTEEQIAAIEEFDAAVFRSDRRFYVHNRPYPECETSRPVAGAETDAPADKAKPDWLEEIEDPQLLEFLQGQSREVLQIVELLVFRGFSQRKAARELRCSPQNVNFLWRRFRRDAAACLKGRGSGGSRRK